MIDCLFVVAFVIDLIPLWAFNGLIRDWARSEGIRALRYRVIAVVGWVLGAVAAHTGAVLLTARLFPQQVGWAPWVAISTFLLAGLVGATIAPGLAYLALRLRTGHHEDYEPLDPDEEG